MYRLDSDKNEDLLKFLISTLKYERLEHLFSKYLLNEDDSSLLDSLDCSPAHTFHIEELLFLFLC